MAKAKIPATLLEAIVEENYSKAKGNTKTFFNGCFKDIIDKLRITDYQARASKTGEMFEHAFWYLIKQNGVELERDIPLKNACMLGGGALDFGILNKNKLICGIEAKGSSEKESVRPALKRTDTAKKAIAQAYQFKRIFPKIPFFVVANVLPTSGNAKCMLDLAEGDIIDKIVDLTDDAALKEFVATLKNIEKLKKKS